jgi:UDP-glucose 4-epimerase
VAATLAHVGADVTVSARHPEAARSALARHGVRCEVRAFDLAHAGEAARLLQALRPSVVFNLAGYGVDPSERDEALAVRLNCELVAELAEQVQPASGWRGQTLVHAGSALEFGEQRGDFADPWSCAPTTLYGRTKLAGSAALRDITRRRGVRAVTARLFTVYGPGEHPSRLLPTLMAASKTEAAIPLTAGLQQRDFTYVGDVAHGLLRLGALHEAVGERALNLATGRLTTVREFASEAARVLAIAPERLRFGELPTRTEEMSHSPVSISALEKALAWKPSTAIREGLHEALAFERAHPVL